MDERMQLAAVEAQVRRLLADALASDVAHMGDIARRDQLHVDELDRRDGLHLVEMDRRDGLHHAEMARRDEAHQSAMTQRDDAHEHEMELLRAALASRDLIGQAKGVIIAALGCTPDAAFEMLRAQSMHENRKLAQVAQTVVDQAIRARQSRPPR